MLLKFWHGVGDHLQLGVVLRHLRQRGPRARIDLACHQGKTPWGFTKWADATYELGQQPANTEYEIVRGLNFDDPTASYADHPSTKAEKCLIDVFGIKPDPALCGYGVTLSTAAAAFVQAYPPVRGPFVLIHHAGICNKAWKDLSEHELEALCKAISAHGIAPLVLRLPTKQRAATVREPMWGKLYPNPDTIMALAAKAVFCVGIDSGPGKLFAAAGAPTLIAWGWLHPVHYHCPGGRTFHSVRAQHAMDIKPPRALGEVYFAHNYNFRERRQSLVLELPALVDEYLKHGLPGMSEKRCEDKLTQHATNT